MAKRAQSRQTGDGEQKFTFKNAQLFKNETLGTGSYGAVCKAKCDQLMCAAKLIWPALLQLQAPDPGKEHRQPFQRFESECRFLSHINHPNIVQYLGTYYDPETNTPVLLMELMDESLTHYLESSAGEISHHIQVNLASDIAQALAFLHANGIIHRDLSSNNVLLIAGSRAKVTDFGMLKFISTARLATMTTCPGTPAFMSPEALNEPPAYTEKLDTFSFGVLLVQIVTRKFPNPSNRFNVVRISNPENPACTVEAKIDIPEIERRQAHINLIEPTHPLLPTALHCLKDRDVERPSSPQLCQSLDALKKTARYEKSSQNNLLRAKDDQIRATQEQIRTNEEELRTKKGENGHLTHEIRILRNKNTTLQQGNQALQTELATKERELMRFKQQLEGNEEITATLQKTLTQRDREVSELREKLTSKNEEIQDLSSRLHRVALQEHQVMLANERRINMVWETLPDAPVRFAAGSSAVIDGKGYFRPRGSENVYIFNLSNKQWYSLPVHPLMINGFTIVGVDNILTTVGGPHCSVNSNKLFSYIHGMWLEHFPPMPTKREAPGALYTNNTLVVAGGRMDSDNSLATVDAFDVQSMKWSSASTLPFPTSQPSMAMYGNCIYLHTGIRSPDRERCSVLKCSLSALVKSKPGSAVWERITSLPVHHSSIVAINGLLLAVGGADHKDISTADIHQYNPSTSSWHVVNQTVVGRYRSRCLTASLPGSKLMVVGGYTTIGYPACQGAEVATLM